MTDAVPPELFRTLLRQAGLDLPEGEIEALRQAHGKLQRLLEVLRQPGLPLAAEPAFTFRLEGLDR